MLQSPLPQTSRKGVSLTIRVSALLVLAVVIPLLITVVGSELILRPTLLSQAGGEMENDAQAHVQTIDSYLIARSQDIGFMGQFFAIRKYLAGDATYKQQASNELSVGYHLDPNYTTWTLFDLKGRVRLSYPTQPGPRGKYLIQPGVLQQLRGVNKTMISDVYFDDATRAAFIDIYASITDTNTKQLGIGRATLNLNDIWTAVNNETNAGTGNYAMIIDGHGVRIAYTNIDTTLTTRPVALFKAIAPLSPAFQQRIKDENLYGNSQSAVTVLPDPVLTNLQQKQQGETIFQMQPALQKEAFQVARARSQIIPWTYLALRPVSNITSAANQQEIYLILIAVVVTILAASIGLVIGRGFTRPILQSVTSLLRNSQALKTLASKEQITANEQKWIIESSQVGLQSVQYYAEATSVAARRLDEIGMELVQNWEQLDAQRTRNRLSEVIAAARYIEKAASRQNESSKGLATAIRVTAQVTEQLISGATSATEASTQLDEVVEQLRKVVGR